MEYEPNLYVVWGPPGTGKTTFLAQEARKCVEWAAVKRPYHRHPVVLCSLTRSAAAEIAGRKLPLPRECVGTLHSHAFRSLDNPDIAEAQAKDFNEKHKEFLVSELAVDLDEPEWEQEQRPETLGDQLLAEYSLLRARMCSRELWPDSVKYFAGLWEEWKKETNRSDFNDLIERSLSETDFAPGAPLVLIADEAQDLSALEYKLLYYWGGRTANGLIIAGDPYQSLYTWRGAHPEAFLDPKIPEKRRRVLEQSWRVPRAVHKASMAWISNLSYYKPLRYLPRDAEGTVTRVGVSFDEPSSIVQIAKDYADEEQKVILAASCGYFLKLILDQLKAGGYPFSNPWRRKRRDWNPLFSPRGVSIAQRMAEFMRLDSKSYDSDARIWSQAELHHWCDPLSAKKVLKRGAKQKIARDAKYDRLVTTEYLRECFQADALAAVLRTFERRNEGKISAAQALFWWVENLRRTKTALTEFPLRVVDRCGVRALTREPNLHIGTIHSFKGAESDVVLLSPSLSPRGYMAWGEPGEPRDSVLRTFYVGLTRARDTVVLCGSRGMQVDWDLTGMA